MKIVENKQYICQHCNKVWKTSDEARKCELGHDIVYLPIQRADLKRLSAFIYTGETQLLSKSLIELVSKYAGMKAE